MNLKSVKFAARISISIIIISIIIYFIGPYKIFEALKKIKTEYFLIGILFFLVSTWLTTFAILPLLKTKETYKVFKFKALSWSAGMFLPSKIGETSFILLLKKMNYDTKKSTKIFIVDRLVSFSIVGFFSVIAIIKYFEVKMCMNYLILFVCLLFILLISRNKIKKMRSAERINSLLKDAKNYLKNEKKSIFINYLFSLINFILMFWVFQMVFFSFDIYVSLIDVALISSFATIVSLIPITINGLGVREGILVYLYSLVGISPEHSASVIFIFLASSYVLGIIFLGLYWDEFSFILKKKEEINA